MGNISGALESLILLHIVVMLGVTMLSEVGKVTQGGNFTMRWPFTYAVNTLCIIVIVAVLLLSSPGWLKLLVVCVAFASMWISFFADIARFGRR